MSGFAQDNLFDAPQAVVDFQFDERTVAVFADMIHRSIPAYAGLLQMTAVVAGQFLRDGDHVYDLGCSLGGVSLALRQFVPAQLRISALDLSEAMVKRLRDYLSGAGIENIEVIQADLQDYLLQPCRVAVLNFVLQFIAPEARDAVLEKIYAALPPGGALLIAEKTRPEDTRMQSWYEAFKRSQGYSELAVAQKRESLEHVMKTDAAAVIEARLHKVGFQQIVPYYQGLPFKAWAAIK